MEDGTGTSDSPYLVYALLDRSSNINFMRWENDAYSSLALRDLSDYIDRYLNDSVSYGSPTCPEKIKIEGLVWYKHPTYWDRDNDRIRDFWENKKGYGPATAIAPTSYPTWNLPSTYSHNPSGWDYGYRGGNQNKTMGRDTICPMDQKWCHVWSSPQEALMHPADIELYIHNRAGVRLIDYFGVHYYKEPNGTGTESTTGVKTWKYDASELCDLGLVWVFDTLDYYNGNTQSHDSRYITINHHDGTIIAQNVNEIGATYFDESIDAVDHEPLVRVRLYHVSNISDMSKWENLDATVDGIRQFNALDAKPILDGYIRVHITNSELLEIATYPVWDVTFDLANDIQTRTTTWTQFQELVFIDMNSNMDKTKFNAAYKIEQEDPTDNTSGMVELAQYAKPRATESEDSYYTYKKLPVAPTTWAPTSSNKDQYKVGQILMRRDEHTFFWRIKAEEMDALTHGLSPGNEIITIERFIHYTGHFYSSTSPNNAAADYDDIFIKLILKLKRAEIPISVTSTRDENYWYSWEGSWTPFMSSPDAENLRTIAFNSPYPNGNSKTTPWSNEIRATWDANKVNVTNAYGGSKFYFAPFEYEIKALDGTIYIVTPRRGSGDNIFNKFICKYWNTSYNYQLDQSNPFNSSKIEENNNILKTCAIRYQPDAAGIQSVYGMAVATVENPSAWPNCDGVFSNDTLYAIPKSMYNSAREYEPIAIITDTDTGSGGHVVLLHEYVKNQWLNTDAQPSGSKYSEADPKAKENAYTEACLNAVGYITNVERDATTSLMTGVIQDKGNPLNKQLRSYVGVIGTRAANIANQMNDRRTKNFTVFQMPWERPLNMLVNPGQVTMDETGVSVLYALDMIKLFDWRGASPQKQGSGYMWDNQTWLWAYYGVRDIQIDTRPNMIRILTDGSTMKALSTLSNTILVTAMGQRALTNFVFDLSSFNQESSNANLLTYMDEHKALFGYIQVEDLDSGLDAYDLYIPINVVYDWGILSETLTIHVGKPKTPILEISSNELAFEESGGTQVITITSNGDWQVKIPESASWLTANVNSGNSNAQIMFSVQKNYSWATRTAQVVVSGNGIDRNISITQGAYEEGYYYVGSQNNWDITDRNYPFTRLEDGVTWEISMPTQADDMFLFIPSTTTTWDEDIYRGQADQALIGKYVNDRDSSNGKNFTMPNNSNIEFFTMRIIPAAKYYEIELHYGDAIHGISSASASSYQVIDAQGRWLRQQHNSSFDAAIRGLQPGLYLINGKKVVVK